MNWNGKHVLVTGAGGFIGSHLTERLVSLGARVRVFIRYNSRGDRGMLELLPEETIREVEIHVGDLKDPFAGRKAVKDCEIVFHLGALIAIPYSYVNPLDFVQTNILGTAHVLEASATESIERVIVTSTSEVYGTAQSVPIREDHALRAQSPYSASKIAADKIAESYFLSFGTPITIIRPFNTFGPRQSGRAVIPTIILQALTGKRVALGSLHPSRDFTYVDDTVSAFVCVAESSAAAGQTINVGSGREILIGDLAKTIIGIIGHDVELIEDPRRVRPPASEVDRLLADNSRARMLLGWSPSMSLEQGLALTVEWYRANLNRYRCEEYVI